MLDFDAINKNIFVGSVPKSVSDLNNDLLPDKVDAVISLTEESIVGAGTLEKYLWIPIKNNSAGLFEQIEQAVALIDEMVDQDKKVYIHCRFGQGRAPFIAVAYFIHKGMGFDEALRLVNERRPASRINSEQMKVLQEYYLKVGASK